MAAHSQFGVRVPSVPSDTDAWIGTVPASNRRLEAYAIVPIGTIGSGDRVGAAASETSLLRLATVVETALIAVLFLLISGLVAIRLAEAFGDRDVDTAALLSRLWPRSDDSSAAGGSAGPKSDPNPEPDRSPTTDHRPFERYIAPDTPSELLSDEGEVVRLLVANDGQLRQHRIADETGWSKSKVSRICSQMDADGIIEKASVGRENVITLSDRPADDSAGSDDVENPVP